MNSVRAGTDRAHCPCGWPLLDCAIRASGNKPEDNLHLSCAARDFAASSPVSASTDEEEA